MQDRDARLRRERPRASWRHISRMLEGPPWRVLCFVLPCHFPHLMLGWAHASGLQCLVSCQVYSPCYVRPDAWFFLEARANTFSTSALPRESQKKRRNAAEITFRVPGGLSTGSPRTGKSLSGQVRQVASSGSDKFLYTRGNHRLDVDGASKAKGACKRPDADKKISSPLPSGGVKNVSDIKNSSNFQVLESSGFWWKLMRKNRC